MAKPSGERHARDGDTEQRILDAAHRVFIRRGTAGARMQEIADEAGVNKALLHYYFRTKSRLATAVFQRTASTLFARVLEVFAGGSDLDETVPRVMQIYMDQLSRTPYVPGYILSELNQHPERAQQFVEALHDFRRKIGATDLLTIVQQQIQARVSAGTMRPITADQFIVNLASLCIFPFAARPMLMSILGIDDAGFARFIKKRRATLPQFFLHALRP